MRVMLFLVLTVALAADPSSPTLEEFQVALNAGYRNIIDAIPQRHAFAEGDTGFNIGDGGNDMFDGGNILSTNLRSELQYTSSKIVSTDAFGRGSRYFTRKFPEGLFVMAAENNGAAWFQVLSNYGADDEGEGVATTIEYRDFTSYVLRISGTEDASVTKIIVLRRQPGISRAEDTSTEEGYLQANGL